MAALLVLSRLQGGVGKQALRFTTERDGLIYVGENAFALPAIAAQPAPKVEAQPSGLSLQFARWLGHECGLHEQDNVTIHLDKFFAFGEDSEI